MGLVRKGQTFQELAGARRYFTGRFVICGKSFASPVLACSVLIAGPDFPAKSEPYDRVDGKHELAAARAVIIRPRTECVFIPDFRTSGDQLVEVVSDSHGPARVGCRKARPLAFLVVQNVQWANRDEVFLRKLPLGVVHESYH